MKFGLIGEKLAHSFSKEVHSFLTDESYELCELKREELPEFFNEKSFSAINVTIPYKKEVLQYLDEVDSAAKEIGSVNTIVNRNGRLFGYNTDFGGLKRLIEKHGFNLKNKTVLVLGSGGTSEVAKAVCKSLGAKETVVVSRKGKVNYENAALLYKNAQFIINTTPCGMFPDNGSMPIEPGLFSNLEGVVDVIYNPLKTRLILECEKRGIQCCGGLYMLTSQAILSGSLFYKKEFDEKLFEEVYEKILLEKRNIVLTGMPGSGKTTLGLLLAEKLNRKFVDTDRLIEYTFGMKIADYFAAFGEERFRSLEASIIKDISKQSSLVISVGGGTVLNSENVSNLRQNGKLFFLDREPSELIPTSSRPLADTKEKIEKLYSERLGIYLASADVIIKDFSSPQKTVGIIEEKIYENSYR